MLTMKQSIRQVIHSVAALVALSLVSVACASDLAAQLINEKDDAYIQARTASLGLDDAAFAQLLNDLRQSQEEDMGRFLAYVLEVRREYPQDCAIYDQSLIDTVENPTMARHGRAVYLGPSINRNLALSCLFIESTLKYTWVPDALVQSLFLRIMGLRPPREYLEGLLLVVQENSDLGHHVAPLLARIGNEHDDPRIIPAIKDIYIWHRTNEPENFRAAYQTLVGLREMASPEALVAVEQLRQLERDFAENQGLAPWDDNNVRQDHIDAAMKVGAVSSERVGTPEYEQDMDKLHAVRRRLQAVNLWESFDKAISEISTRIADDQAGE